MNTSYLRTFIEVINLKNISKAAEKMFITQPAVSKQLQLLEKDFGAELFKKNGREIIPTEEGFLLYKYAKAVLNEENKIYSLIRRDDDKLYGNLDIYTSSMPADYYIHDLIIEFSSLYPDASFTIKKIDSDMVFKNIEDGFTSFGFTGSPSKNKKIKNICIAEDEVVIVASAQKKNEFKQNAITMDMLLNQRFIVREKGSATLKIFEDYLNKKRINLSDLHITIQAEDNEIIKKFISKNAGIAVLPKKAVEQEVADGSMEILNIDGMDLRRKLYYVYQQDRYFSKIEEKFKEFMIHMYEK
ncbi:MAG: LysR family transcriptional regulator [Sedimentibacter sp.]|jgi:DNA-binding transcriptional LysR family regulator|nr:LysR family transcriptional regulator [Sedimentibacter sp.]